MIAWDSRAEYVTQKTKRRSTGDIGLWDGVFLSAGVGKDGS